MISRETEALGIFATHGVLDVVSTALAYEQMGASGETNPIVRSILLDYGIVDASFSILLVVALVATIYPSVARIGRFPPWFAPLLIGVGLVSGAINLLVASGALA